MKKLLFIACLLVAISSSAQDFVDSIPTWFNNPPTSSKKFYGVGEGKSRSMGIADQKAMLSANLQIAEQVEPAKVKDIKTKSTSVDGKISEEIIQREILNVNLTDVRVVKKAYMQSGDMITVYVLLEMKKRK